MCPLVAELLRVGGVDGRRVPYSSDGRYSKRTVRFGSKALGDSQLDGRKRRMGPRRSLLNNNKIGVPLLTSIDFSVAMHNIARNCFLASDSYLAGLLQVFVARADLLSLATVPTDIHLDSHIP